MRLINRIDLFKQNFHFLINKKTSYHTFFGGICSFISIITLVILTYFIGKPLWYHKNPTVTTSTIQTDEQSKVNFSNADIFFAFTIVDTFGNDLEHYKDKIFIDINDYSFDEEIDDYIIKPIPYSQCSNFETKVNGKVLHTFDDFYCLNLTNITITSILNDTYSKIKIDIYTCPPYFTDYSSCLPIKENEAYFNYLSFYYYKPTLYTQPDNYKILRKYIILLKVVLFYLFTKKN